jgi:superoxide oxidase
MARHPNAPRRDAATERRTFMTYSTLIDDLQADGATVDRYDPLSIALHWATLFLIAAIFWSAWAREGAQDGDSAALLLTLHRSLGMLVWLMTLLRLAWKAGFAHRPPLPKTMGPMQRAIAQTMQTLLYGLLFLMPLTGFLQSILRGKPFPLLVGEVPVLIAKDKTAVHLFHEIHETGATVLLVLIGLHALAGLFHGLVRRDGVLEGMLPVKRPSRP